MEAGTLCSNTAREMNWVKTTYEHLTDEALMMEMSKGKDSAFQEIYKRYAQSLHRYFYMRMWKDQEKAQDFVHDLMSKIIHKPEAFDTSRKFKTWIFSVANNMIINEYKKQEVRSNTQSGLDGIGAISKEENIVQQVDENRFKEALEKELDLLDDKHKQTFLLRHVNGFSNKEIAEMLNINEGTVKSRIFYAIKQLSVKLASFKPVIQG
jgi:RNA polymerase sigma-70 factor (ECF subfamily)